MKPGETTKLSQGLKKNLQQNKKETENKTAENQKPLQTVSHADYNVSHTWK